MTEISASWSAYLFDVLLKPWLQSLMVNPLTFDGDSGLQLAANGWGKAIYNYGPIILILYFILAAIDYRRSKSAGRLLLFVALPGFVLQFADLVFRAQHFQSTLVCEGPDRRFAYRYSGKRRQDNS